MRVLCALFLGSVVATAEPDLAALRKQWPGMDRDEKLHALMSVSGGPSAAVLTELERWVKDRDLVVRSQVLRLIAGHAADETLRRRTERILAAYVRSHLKFRRNREKMEFNHLHNKERKPVPPETAMKAGADWTDPYALDRKLPKDIVAERLHMRELVAAIESTGSQALRQTLLNIFLQHHDPVVLIRVVEAFAARKEWHALVPMADLVRIQQFGRAMGGGDVIGNKLYQTLRLKWDVYKDELWWSRPEYVPRVVWSIGKAASGITGASIRGAKDLDGWLLDNPKRLKQHGVTLSGAFRTRAGVSQR